MAEMSLTTAANLSGQVINVTEMHCQATQELGSWVLRIVLIIVMIMGLPGNIVALWIFSFRKNFWKPHTLFLFNLVLSDFLLVVSVPFRMHTDLQGNNWVFGQMWCRINLFMLAVNRSASIAFMTMVALDRYFKVVHPHHRISRMTLTQAGWFAGLMWTVVVALRIPLLTTDLLRPRGNISVCRSFDGYTVTPLAVKVHYVAFTAEFFLPWFLLLFCSGRIVCHLHQRRMDKQKRLRRAIGTVVVISLVFTICFLPSIVTGLGAVYIKRFHPEDCTSYSLITQSFKMCIEFTYLNSALDPVIYCFSSSMFRGALKSFVKRDTRESAATMSTEMER